MDQVERIFIIGFMGSDTYGLAHDLAESYGWEILSLDEEIEKKDGRSVKKICMTMGEHEYRNKECELLEDLCSKKNRIIVCGDGIILDDRSVDILKDQKVFVADLDLPVDALWERAKAADSCPYAFMLSPDEKEKYKKFCQLYQARRHLYEQFL